MYLRQLGKTILDKGADNIVYIDKSGFEHRVNSAYVWAKRGQKLYDEVTGKQEPRQNLIADRRGKQMLTPILIAGSINAQCFEQWLSTWLFQELAPDSTLIMDNAMLLFIAKV